MESYIRVGCGLGVVGRSVCLVLGPVGVCGLDFFFNCPMLGQASDSMAALA